MRRHWIVVCVVLLTAAMAVWAGGTKEGAAGGAGGAMGGSKLGNSQELNLDKGGEA